MLLEAAMHLPGPGSPVWSCERDAAGGDAEQHTQRVSKQWRRHVQTVGLEGAVPAGLGRWQPPGACRGPEAGAEPPDRRKLRTVTEIR